MSSRNLLILTFLAALSMCIGTVFGGTLPRTSSYSFNEEENETEREVQRENEMRDRRRQEPEAGKVIRVPIPFFLEVASANKAFATAPMFVQGENSLRNGTGGPLLL